MRAHPAGHLELAGVHPIVVGHGQADRAGLGSDAVVPKVTEKTVGGRSGLL